MALGVAYYLTYEPAFEVAIRWREGTTWQRRAQIERQFGLAEARNLADWTVWYDLIDTRPATIRALASQPEVAGFEGVNLDTFAVPPDAPYGKGWMWIGPRLPVLRHRGVVPGVIVACALAIAWAVAGEARAHRDWWRSLRLRIDSRRRPPNPSAP